MAAGRPRDDVWQERERAIPWGTSFRTLPHEQLKQPEHGMVRRVAPAYPCLAILFSDLAPAHSSRRVGVFFIPTKPITPPGKPRYALWSRGTPNGRIVVANQSLGDTRQAAYNAGDESPLSSVFLSASSAKRCHIVAICTSIALSATLLFRCAMIRHSAAYRR
jgi:hypothetical protein